MNVALLGFGTVGKAFYSLAEDSESIHVVQVLSLTKQEGVRCRQTLDFSDILEDSSVDLVVELIGGLHPAFEYITAAMRAKKHVVTANKHLMCVYYKELVSLAFENGVSLRCTAAAGGSIPWLTSLSRAAKVDYIEDIWGIMNGTTNYILSAMTRSGATYARSLREAQQRGFAEADPTADVEGHDAQRKIVLSANIGFGVTIRADAVPCLGIDCISSKDVAVFRESGYVCKLIAHAHRREGKVIAAVEPMLLPQTSIAAQVEGANNLICLCGEHIGKQCYSGAGAGGYPTACNVLSDCLTIHQGCSSFYRSSFDDVEVDDSAYATRYYIRGCPNSTLPFGEHMGEGFITQRMTLAVAHQKITRLKERYPKLFTAAVMEEKDAEGC